MIRKLALFVLCSAALIFGAELNIDNPAPQQGEKITWTVPDFDREVDDPVLLMSVYTTDTLLPEIIPAEKQTQGWQFSFNVPDDAIFLSYQVEDNRGTLLEDEGLPFGTVIYTDQGIPCYDANLFYAVNYVEFERQDPERAKQLLQEELNHYPYNWATLVFLRRIQMVEGEVAQASVLSELDSLMQNASDSLEALHFVAMEYLFSISNKFSKGQQAMLDCAQKFPSSRYWIDYEPIIYSAISQVPGAMTHYESTIFPLLEGDAKISAFKMLIRHTLDTRQLTKAEQLMEGMQKEFPSTQISPGQIIQYLQLKHQQPNSQWAKELEKWIAKSPDDIDMRLQLASYYLDRDWKQAVKYYREAIKNTDVPQPAILFAEAAAEKGKNFAEARKYLHQAIETVNMDRYRILLSKDDFFNRRQVFISNKILLHNSLGWLDYKSGDYQAALAELLRCDSLLIELPGYEKSVYERLLEISEKAGNLDARKIAFLNLLTTDPQNRDYLMSLEDIYIIETGNTDGFGDWLDEEINKISLRFRLNQPAGDFTVTDLDDNETYLSDYNGKVVVVNFWATWCGPCKDEIPELNQLVEKYADNDDVVFMAISAEDKPTVTGFLAKTDFNYDMYIDNQGLVSRMYQISSIPTHLIIDREGLIQYKHVGTVPGITDGISDEIDDLLGRD